MFAYFCALSTNDSSIVERPIYFEYEISIDGKVSDLKSKCKRIDRILDDIERSSYSFLFCALEEKYSIRFISEEREIDNRWRTCGLFCYRVLS